MNLPQNIIESLNQFEVIPLRETESLQLFNRIETKYILNVNNLENILSDSNSNYMLVENNKVKMASYLNEYYDTPNFLLYLSHHNGKSHRFKLRRRCYLDNNKFFLELKEKTNIGRTIKKRILLKDNEPQEHEIDELKKNLPSEFQNLDPVIKINYNRITLINKTKPERVTIDLNINAEYNDASFSFNNLVIIEVKQKEVAQTSFTDILKVRKIKKVAISKYCFSVCNLVKGIRTNNFKELNLKINKLML